MYFGARSGTQAVLDALCEHCPGSSQQMQWIDTAGDTTLGKGGRGDYGGASTLDADDMGA